MRKGLYIIVILIGLLQIIGYLTGLKPIRNLGILSASSPLPIVFTEVKGVETFASDFYLSWKNEAAEQVELKITAALYSKFKGPYNRRNIYGAAISYGPILPPKMWQQVLTYGLCNDILKNELDIPVTNDNFSILIKTRTNGKTDEWKLNANCTP